MSEAAATNKRRTRHDDSEATTGEGAAEARKRRAFLQTMGQQLREFGTEGTSPQDHSRITFGTGSPSNARPSSRMANMGRDRVLSRPIETPENDAAPGEDDQLPAGAARSASKWLWKSDEVVRTLPNATAPFSFEDLLSWSQSYFDNWHPAFPFLHAPSLLDYFRMVAQRGVDTASSHASTGLQYVILRSVMSISAVDRRQTTSVLEVPHAVPSTLVFHSFNDAINSTMMVLTEESSILSLQALVSVQLFLVTMHRYNAASRLEGLAVRIAFQLGLHQCPMQLRLPSDKESELRKRLFWSIFCIDRYTCIRLGTPLGIRSEDMNVCYPHTERHGDTSEETDRDGRLDLLDFLARHAHIRGSIMEVRDRSTIDIGPNGTDEVMTIEADHTKWWNVVDEYLSDDELTGNIIKAHQVMLIVLRFESVLALHRSVLATSIKNSAYNAALQRCISASRSIINTLHKALKGFGAFDGSPGQNGYESTPLLWPSFTWAVWMSTFIIVFAATEKQVSRDVALRLADRSIHVLKHLALRGTSWPEACIVAIQNLTSRLNGASSRSSTVPPSRTTAPRVPESSAQSTSAQQFRQHSREASESRSADQQRLPLGHGYFNTSAAHTTGPPLVGSAHHHLSVHNPLARNVESFGPNSAAMANPNLQDTPHFASLNMAGSGNFLGIAQQSSDVPMPSNDIIHLFNGEDMAFWLGGNFGMGLS